MPCTCLGGHACLNGVVTQRAAHLTCAVCMCNIDCFLPSAQVHGPHIDSVAAYEQQCADIKRAKAIAWAARKQKAAARKAQKLAKQQVNSASHQAMHRAWKH